MLRNNIQKNYHIHISAKHRLLGLKPKDVWQYRDLSRMYVTPVVYPVSMLNDGWMKTVLLLNPAATTIEFYRYALPRKGRIDPIYLTISWITTIMGVQSSLIRYN